jgi:hypothetical protein
MRYRHVYSTSIPALAISFLIHTVMMLWMTPEEIGAAYAVDVIL